MKTCYMRKSISKLAKIDDVVIANKSVEDVRSCPRKANHRKGLPAPS